MSKNISPDAAPNATSQSGQDRTERLLAENIHIVFSTAKRFSNADPEELVSDGLLALLSAVRTYDEGKGGFEAYASSCVYNRMKSVAERSAKHAARFPLQPDGFEEIPDTALTPEEAVIESETSRELKSDIKSLLTPLESSCIEGVIMGLSYAEIAKRLGKSRKTVDNALSRARTKLRKRYGDRLRGDAQT